MSSVWLISRKNTRKRRRDSNTSGQEQGVLKGGGLGQCSKPVNGTEGQRKAIVNHLSKRKAQTKDKLNR